ncbi:MAG: hypothetical protein K1X83_01755 [Oligoflexia bacterium]|nr:hypothetical protein [Oligoflexia bacterium]
MKNVTLFLVFLCTLTLLCTGAVWAANPDDNGAISKDKQLPKSGSLSSSGDMTAGGSAKVGLPWGSDTFSGANAPIGGSVFRTSPREWTMKLANNSKDTYSASVAVYQYDKNQRKIKTDNFSYTLKPGQTTQRAIGSAISSTVADLSLLSWKKIGGKTEKTPAAADSAAPTEGSEDHEGSRQE